MRCQTKIKHIGSFELKPCGQKATVMVKDLNPLPGNIDKLYMCTEHFVLSTKNFSKQLGK